jgi:hypothetical protein
MSADNLGLVAALVVVGSAVFLNSCAGLIRFLKRARQWEARKPQVLRFGLAVFLISALFSLLMYGMALHVYLRKR